MNLHGLFSVVMKIGNYGFQGASNCFAYRVKLLCFVEVDKL